MRDFVTRFSRHIFRETVYSRKISLRSANCLLWQAFAGGD
jgi:hypothetical protein